MQYKGKLELCKGKTNEITQTYSKDKNNLYS